MELSSYGWAFVVLNVVVIVTLLVLLFSKGD